MPSKHTKRSRIRSSGSRDTTSSTHPTRVTRSAAAAAAAAQAGSSSSSDMMATTANTPPGPATRGTPNATTTSAPVSAPAAASSTATASAATPAFASAAASSSSSACRAYHAQLVEWGRTHRADPAYEPFISELDSILHRPAPLTDAERNKLMVNCFVRFAGFPGAPSD